MIVWRPRAWQALEAQSSWLCDQAGLPTANRFVDAVQSTLELIEAEPNIGRLWDDPPRTLPGLRWLLVRGFRSHLLFYRHNRGSLEVVHLLHGARDIASILGESM